MPTQKLWYCAPAGVWEEAMPIGNGRLGAMVHGGIAQEHLQLNEDSIWYGGPRDRNNPDALAHLPKIRDLIWQQRLTEAEALARATMTALPENQRHYEPLGDLIIDLDGTEEGVTEYRRELDLARALVTISYRRNGVRMRRQCFASAADQVIIVHLSADRPGSISAVGRLRRLGMIQDGRPLRYSHYADTVQRIDGCEVHLNGSCGGEGAVRFVAGVRLVAEGGSKKILGDRFMIEGADTATFIIGAATTFYHERPQEVLRGQLLAAAEKPFDALLDRHEQDHRRLFNRVDLQLDAPGRCDIPTDQRLKALADGAEDEALPAEDEALPQDDPHLAKLYFDFGRYLLIASSRPGTLPANLQGIWNHRWLPPWDSKYTININTEMNYWPAEVCALPELHEPMFALLQRMRDSGRVTARTMYGARGFCCHHNTDLWADTAPQGEHLASTYWPMGAVWFCTHLWEHYLFTQDRQFLKSAYPAMKEAAEFLLNVLVPDAQGRLVIGPSVSPENTYLLPDGQKGTLCMGAAMDSQLAAALLTQCIEAAAILGMDEAICTEAAEALQRLPQPSIGRHGQLMEWLEDYDEAEPGHRHISHLWGLYPGSMIDPQRTPDLAAAARVTLQRRLAAGGGRTGWSRAWIIALYARLLDGAEAARHLTLMLTRSTYPSLLCAHPPFQIDGNLGSAAAIAEMLLQSHTGQLRLLPALPPAWSGGSVRGLQARGGFTVDIAWQEGRLQSAQVRAAVDQTLRIRADVPLELLNDAGQIQDGGEGGLVLSTRARHSYSFRARFASK